MQFVVDASVAVKLLVEEAQSDEAREVLANATALHAPRLLASEVANVLWRKVRSRQLDRAMASTVINSLTDMPIRWHDDEIVTAHGLHLAMTIDHPFYDCLYLALAYRIGTTMVTADKRFMTAVAHTEHESKVVTLTTYGKIH
ncbi:MAG: type II toxin-antitoxin system VapC family toxin [Gammaproteobacteria bacterium]|nr:type II toxin-antitoxin system VapC family toxin [Gammaproteobacteria bacterium]